MDLPALSSVSAATQQAATGSDYSVGIARKVIDLAASEGAMLARMIDSSAGVGRNIDTHA